jgi:hypothetical protein
MKHKHHIIPKYRGGSDHKDNLIELSVTQHAMFHSCNWELWNRWEDYFAWKGLTGEIGKEEIISKARERGREKGTSLGLAKIKFLYENDFEYREKQILHTKKVQKLAVEAAKSEEAREKRKKTLKEINHQKGENNPSQIHFIL